VVKELGEGGGEVGVVRRVREGREAGAVRRLGWSRSSEG